MTKTDKIINFLKKYPNLGLTKYEAAIKFRFVHLGGLVGMLKNKGYKFRITYHRTSDNRSYYSRYYLTSSPKSNKK